MKITRIDGHDLEQMLTCAVRLLTEHEKEINSLNVFPVADGDTGTNMRLTLQNGMRMAHSEEKLCVYLKDLSNAMLLSARGNSGVILSQLMKGFYLELARCTAAGTEELRNAFIRAHKAAYEAVINPVEGTMLTVAREGIENIKAQVTRRMLPEELMEIYIEEMERVLARTPDMLPVLKESGVIDSGGRGYITIVRGMWSYLAGVPVTSIVAEPAVNTGAPVPADFSLFTEDSTFEDGYCMEFILQRMKDANYAQQFDRAAFVTVLESMGNSIVCVENDMRVKVHIHTKQPAPIIALCQRYGEFLTFKLENMQIQHNEYDRDMKPGKPEKPTPAPKPWKPISIVTVAQGAGMTKIFTDQGSDTVLDGGDTMSVSAQEFLETYEQANADEICVFPNSGNALLAAEQARSMFTKGAEHVHVIPTHSMAECYVALAMDIPDEPSVTRRISLMTEGAQGVTVLSAARSVKDFTHDGRAYEQGSLVVFVNGEPAASGSDLEEALREVLDAQPLTEDKETCIAFRGAHASEDDEALIEDIMTCDAPLMDFTPFDGGQETYDWIIALY